MKPNHIHGIIITNNPCLAGRQAVGTGHALSVNVNWNCGYVSCQELTPIDMGIA
ncbi:MAG: hypothetical protein KKD55_02225 [Candidatus Omnitrophica bacterium]|nr:hypothetical protein [Candidatus Omnitrophota bacterium]